MPGRPGRPPPPAPPKGLPPSRPPSPWRPSAAAAGFVLGTLCGALLAGTVTWKQVEDLTRQNDFLATRLVDHQNRVERLEAELREREAANRFLVRAVDIRVNVKDAEVRTRVERYARSQLAELVGKEVSRIDPYLVEQALDGRTLTTGDDRWALTVRRTHVWEVVTVELDVEAARTAPPPSPE